MTDIEQARIDVHHAAEQVAAIEYVLEKLRKEQALLHERFDAANYECAEIQKQFRWKCTRLAEMRDNA